MKYNKNLVKYHLKDKKETGKKTQIFLIFFKKGVKLRYYIQRRIEPKYWKFDKQRASTSYPNYRMFNAFLDTIANYLEDEYNKLAIQDKKINTHTLRALLDDRIRKENNKQSFIGRFEEFIDTSENVRKPNTIKKYKTTKKRLDEFEKARNFKLSFDSIDFKFEEEFKDYLIKVLNLSNNSISKYFKTLKVFLNWAIEKGYNKNIDFQKFKAKQTEGEIYFLTWEELMNLLELECEDKKLEKVRDIFCFGCFTGLRFSDIMNLKQENFGSNVIELNTIKTGTRSRIPLNKYSKAIFEKYKSDENDFLFPTISNQKMNAYLKYLGKEAELNEPVSLVKFSGTKRTEEVVPKYEVLTTHIARKTFITNAMIRGMSTEVIMDITTHNSYKSFSRYFKIVDEYKQEQMDKVFG